MLCSSEHTEPETHQSVASQSGKCSCSFRYFRSKGALVLLLWNTLAMSTLTLPGFMGDSSNSELYASKPLSVWIGLIVIAICYMLYFIPGMIADTWVGRYRVVVTSLGIMWSGALLATMGSALTGVLRNMVDDYDTVISLTATAIIYIGKAGFQTNLLPLGCDEMADVPSYELSSFVSWFAFTENLGYGLGFSVSFLLYHWLQVWNYSVVATGLLLSLLYCLTLSINICYTRNWLPTEHVKSNPYGTVFKVLRYAWKHKFPERRSALTYWEEGLPSRIDLGKSKYGGPFTVEQVEDVKTLGRILSVLLASLVTLIGGIAGFLGASLMYVHLGLGETFFTLWSMDIQFISYTFVVLVPVYEFILQPFFKKFIPSILKRMWIGAFFFFLCAASNLLIDSVGHRVSEDSVYCLFTSDHNASTNGSSPHLETSSYFLIAPTLFASLGYFIGYISTMEFLVAQSPLHMKGMLIGLFYSLWGLGTLSGLLIALPFFFAYPPLTSSTGLSCGSAYYLICFGFTVVGMVSLTVAVRRYRNREREEVLGNEQQFAISYYERDHLLAESSGTTVISSRE